MIHLSSIPPKSHTFHQSDEQRNGLRHNTYTEIRWQRRGTDWTSKSAQPLPFPIPDAPHTDTSRHLSVQNYFSSRWRCPECESSSSRDRVPLPTVLPCRNGRRSARCFRTRIQTIPSAGLDLQSIVTRWGNSKGDRWPTTAAAVARSAPVGSHWRGRAVWSRTDRVPPWCLARCRGNPGLNWRPDDHEQLEKERIRQ